mgnify:CR=1 FL=1
MNPAASNQTSRQRTVGFRLGAVLLGSAVAFVSAELVLRALDVWPHRMLSKRVLVRGEPKPVLHYHCYTTNPTGELQPLPDTTVGVWALRSAFKEDRYLSLRFLPQTPWCVEYDRSSRGMRDREYTPLAPPGTLRIAAVGDSFVFGEGVPLDRTISRQMESLLGDDFEVLNAGMPGLDTADEINVVELFARDLNCTRAIVMFVPNDVAPSDDLLARQNRINDLINLRDDKMIEHHAASWYGWSRVLSLLQPDPDVRRIGRETVQWYLDLFDPQHNGDNLRALRRNIRVLSRVPGCRVAIVLYPLLIDLADYPLAQVHARIAAWARESGIPVLDLTPVLASSRTETLWVHPTDHHPNGHAHSIAAAEIVRWLREDQPDFLQAD